MNSKNTTQYYLLTLPLAIVAGLSGIHLIDIAGEGSGLRQVAYGSIAYETDMGRYPRKTAAIADFDTTGGLEQFPVSSGNKLPTVESSGGFTGDGLRFVLDDTTETGQVGVDIKEALDNAVIQFDVRVNGPTGGGFALFEGFSANPFVGAQVQPSHLALRVTSDADSYIPNSPVVDDIFGDPVSGDLWNFSINGAPNEELNLQVGRWYGLAMGNNDNNPSLVDLLILADGKEAFLGSFPAQGDLSELGFMNLGTDEVSGFGDVSFDDIAVSQIPEPSTLALAVLALCGCQLVRRRRTRS